MIDATFINLKKLSTSKRCCQMFFMNLVIIINHNLWGYTTKDHQNTKGNTNFASIRIWIRWTLSKDAIVPLQNKTYVVGASITILCWFLWFLFLFFVGICFFSNLSLHISQLWVHIVKLNILRRVRCWSKWIAVSILWRRWACTSGTFLTLFSEEILKVLQLSLQKLIFSFQSSILNL